jgi:hypothetical protein
VAPAATTLASLVNENEKPGDKPCTNCMAVGTATMPEVDANANVTDAMLPLRTDTRSKPGCVENAVNWNARP